VMRTPQLEGDIIRTIRPNIQYIAHFHTGGVPGRRELDGTQELQWRAGAEPIVGAGGSLREPLWRQKPAPGDRRSAVAAGMGACATQLFIA
jgi:hypothetical protein